MMGHVFAALFLKNLGVGVDQIDDPQVMSVAHLFSKIHHLLVFWVAPFALAFIAFLQIQLIRGKSAGWGIDLIGGLLTFRCLVIFLMLNLLLLSHLKAGGLLLMQLILFIPVITIDLVGSIGALILQPGSKGVAISVLMRGWESWIRSITIMPPP